MNNVWEGVFREYSEAKAQIDILKIKENVFDTLNWLNRHDDKSNFTVTQSFEYLRPTNLPILLCNTVNPVILDLGGASGWVYHLSKEINKSISKYLVIDRPNVVEYFRKQQDTKLHFHTLASIYSLDRIPDCILYSNSTIQYMQNNSQLIELAKYFEPGFILLDEAPLTNFDSDWFSLQINSDLPTIYRFISRKVMLDELNALGYQLCWESDTSGPSNYSFPSMENFESSRQIISAKSLLFKKI